MPVYIAECNACGWFDDNVFVSLANYDPAGIPCRECGAMARRVIAPVMTVGIKPSQPLVVEQIGETFETNADLRRWERENPGKEIVSAADPKWTNFKDKVRAKAERRARQVGYKDLDERLRLQKKETQRRKELGDAS